MTAANGSPERRPGIGRIPRRRLFTDRALGIGIRFGGAFVIALVLAILVFLVLEAWPLAAPTRMEAGPRLALPAPARSIAMDEYQTHVGALGSDGVLRVLRTSGGAVVAEKSLLERADGEAPAAVANVLDPPSAGSFAASTTDGRVVVSSLQWHLTFENNVRRVIPEIGPVRSIVLDPAGRPVSVATVRTHGDQTTVIGQLVDGTLVRVRHLVVENPFSGDRSESLERDELPVDRTIRRMVLDPDQRTLYAAGADGEILWWDLSEATPRAPRLASGEMPPITALALLTGGRSLVVGRQNGDVEIWFRVRHSELSERLTRIRTLDSMAAEVTHIAAATRDRMFMASDSTGDLRLYYSTSARTLWSSPAPVDPLDSIAIAPKGNAILVAEGPEIAVDAMSAPHPEASFRAYFRAVWYEGFSEPLHTWQSTGGSDQFESKLGITPLMFGTLKGTVYSLLLAVPLGILGAMYTSQFMHPRYQRLVKPTVEMMASLPTVVLGFVAGLWLAPRLEHAFPAFLGMMVILPAVLLASGLLWSRRPRWLREGVADGGEVGFFALTLALGLWASFASGPWISQVLFGGDFNAWIFDHAGVRVDQRNALVVGIAMGFAVIPIVFSIAEDSLSSVPGNLAAGSLALGANRWETVVRVVLPTASPGIFSAVMVGLGRAVGETMIVLMATGNTPIMDWSAFDGFRTLAANIAVEIPEAPYRGTLYRTLFLTALLLFALTFSFNTVAEVVRQRLRHRYGRL